jgi:hypothetical protein
VRTGVYEISPVLSIHIPLLYLSSLVNLYLQTLFWRLADMFERFGFSFAFQKNLWVFNWSEKHAWAGGFLAEAHLVFILNFFGPRYSEVFQLHGLIFACT